MLEPSTIEVELDGCKTEYACSLASAIKALQRASKRMQGSRPKEIATQGGTTDTWYSDVGEYSLGARRSAAELVMSKSASVTGIGRYPHAPQGLSVGRVRKAASNGGGERARRSTRDATRFTAQMR